MSTFRVERLLPTDIDLAKSIQYVTSKCFDQFHRNIMMSAPDAMLLYYFWMRERGTAHYRFMTQ